MVCVSWCPFGETRQKRHGSYFLTLMRVRVLIHRSVMHLVLRMGWGRAKERSWAGGFVFIARC